jgi:hypothetical protein
VACDTHGGEEKCLQLWWGKLKKGDHLEEPGVGRKIFSKISLKNTPRIGCCGHELDIY